jgi:glycosyltransferase involved in cell wall biosynthesis
MDRLRVIHLSGSDVVGGAAKAAHRLHCGLVEAGVDSHMLVRSKRSQDARVQRLGHPRKATEKLAARWIDRRVERGLRRYASTRPAGYEAFTDDRAGAGRHLMQALPECDVIHLHWVKGLVDYRWFFEHLPAGTHIVWTLHDMNAFTGGCHYDDGCGRYSHGCGACPQLGSQQSDDLSAAVWRRKKEAFEAIDAQHMHVVTPSRWLADLARESPLLKRFNVSAIANGIDTARFAPRDPQVARETLGLPADAKVLLFVAHGLEGHRKGFDLLRQALKQIEGRDDIWLLSAGGTHHLPEVNVPHLSLGELSSDRLLSLVYSAADVFALPSRQDNLPNTALESLACGTPIVGFDAGGISEVVEPGRSGWLAPVGDARALAHTLQEAVDDDGHRAELARQCRSMALARYDLMQQAREYARLYEQLTGKPSGATVDVADQAPPVEQVA